MSYLYILLSNVLILSGIILISVYNPIYKILSLISIFFFGSSLFLILDFYFLGLTYFIVYISAITILFLFVIMMVQLITYGDNSELYVREISNPIPTPTFKINSDSFNPQILLELLRPDPHNNLHNNKFT